MSDSVLSVLFSITAFLYAIVGFGGGSTYNSLLVMGGFDFQYIPIIALTCNLVVVSGGLVYFGRMSHEQLWSHWAIKNAGVTELLNKDSFSVRSFTC